MNGFSTAIREIDLDASTMLGSALFQPSGNSPQAQILMAVGWQIHERDRNQRLSNVSYALTRFLTIVQRQSTG